jgi:hypothetical protein
LQWPQHPEKIYLNNLSNIICEAIRHFRDTKWEYQKNIINELATKSNIKKIRSLYGGINEFKRGVPAEK